MIIRFAKMDPTNVSVGDLTGADSFEMESVSGTVTLVVPSGVSADFELQ